jgi:outer membrane protein
MKTIFLFLLPFAILGQTPLSLDNAISLALMNNYQVKIAQKNVDIAQNNNSWALTGKNPNINATVQSNNGYTNINNPASFLTQLSSISTGLVPSVELNWVLFNGNGFSLNKNRLEELENLNEENAKFIFENTILTTINSYFNLKVIAEQLKVFEEALQLSAERLDWLKTRESFGQSGKFERLQGLDAFYADSTAYLNQQYIYYNSLRTFNSLLGESDLTKEYNLTEDLNPSDKIWNLEELQEKMWIHNSQLKSQQINKSLSLIQTQIQESTQLPQISLRGGLNYNYNLSNGNGTLLSGESLSLNAISSRTLNGTIGLAATYSLYDGGLRKKNIQTAKIQEEIADFNILEVKRNLSLSLANLFGDFNFQKERLSLAENSLKNARENLVIAEERIKNGQISSFDFRTIQLSYFNANQQILNILFTLRLIETEIIRLTEGLVK